MRPSAIIFLLINYCAFLCAQNISFTRDFDTKRKSVPLQIINNHPDYFFMLRYNKLAHDMTIEKRAKSSGNVEAFTALRLDSVNADWFDYEKLDYLFFEHKNQTYFVFEKTLNTKKAIYLKTVDSTGKSSGFKEIATLEKDKSVDYIHFEFKVTTPGKLLIAGSIYYINNTAKKVVLLYDVEKRDKTWIKKLPLENPYTGYSQSYTANADGDLFYLVTKSRINGYKRQYVKNTQLMIPVFFYDSLSLACLSNQSGVLIKRPLAVSNLSGLKNVYIHAQEKQVGVFAMVTQYNAAEENKLFFLSQGFNNDLSTEVFAHVTPLPGDLEKKLTFYDGTDDKSPADKDYKLSATLSADGYLYYSAGRSEENYFKEFLFRKINLRTGAEVTTEIIPRKIFYFDDRTRFKNLGATAQQLCNGNYYAFVLEDEDNLERPARAFDFHKFSRQKYLWGANLMAYIVTGDGAFIKKQIYKNKGYDFVPLDYTSNQTDFVFYLNDGRLEKFAILKLDAN